MRIPGDIPKITGVYDKQKNLGKVDRAYSVTSRKDVVSISGQAKDYQTVIKALREVPDIRQDKVNELAEKYQAGSYGVDGRDVADRILKSTFDSKA